ncbi:hypothetical protein NE865_08789 [Phthorimaea operculella]|nr:hypothetical protein NE865_08789 [Phthorimaea operculella]
MPLQRSPPKLTPKKQDEDEQTVNTAVNNVTYRKERKERSNPTDGFDFQQFTDHLDDLFKVWADKHERNHISILNMIKEIKEQNEGIKKSIEFVTARYDDMELQIKSLEQRSKEDQSRLAILEQKIESLQQAARVSTFEIRNIPVKKEETKEDLCTLATKLGKVLDVSVNATDIKNIHRGYAKPDAVKPIIVEVQSAMLKEKVLASAKSYHRKNRNNQLTTRQMNLEGPPTPVYVSEHLSPTMRRLFSLARDFRSTNGYKYCWATPGAIYLRKKEGDPATRLRSEQDLKKLKPMDTQS